METIIISIICILIFLFLLYLFHFRSNIHLLESELIDLFKKRNYQVVSIYSIGEKYLTKHNEIFKEFISLKKRDFSENIHKLRLRGKLPVYRKIDKEINFIFKVCEKHPELSKHARYNYVKDSLLSKSDIIGKKYKEYENIQKKYELIHTISKFLLVGFLIK